MPFHFTCPYCFKKTLVADALAGQMGPCANCGKDVTIAAAPNLHPTSLQPVDSKYIQVNALQHNRLYLSWMLKTVGLTAIIAVVSMVAIYLLWPTLKGLKARRDKVACINNLQLIARALNEYAAEYGSYPPPVVYDSKGAPMHSWRVLILPHLGEASLHARYDFTQPWDAADNTFVMAQCPDVFISPASSNPHGSESTYALVTGKGTLFPKSGPLRPSDVRDGRERTLLVVEIENPSGEWTNPIDIDFSQLNHRIGATGANTIGGNHAGGATAVFADGTPAWLSQDIDPILLDAIISPNGSEPVDPIDFRLSH